MFQYKDEHDSIEVMTYFLTHNIVLPDATEGQRNGGYL